MLTSLISECRDELISANVTCQKFLGILGNGKNIEKWTIINNLLLYSCFDQY